MCRFVGVVIVALFCVVPGCIGKAIAADEQDSVAPRQKITFNENWRFLRTGIMPDKSLQEEPADLHRSEVDDSSWNMITLPHDWAIAGPFDILNNRHGCLPYDGIGWYRKGFDLTEDDRGKKIYLDVDGAMSNAKVWINGQYVGQWPYGHSSFRMDLTPHLLYDRKNIVAIRLENNGSSVHWYPGAGINRNVYLVKTMPVHVAHWGVYVTTPDITDSRAVVNLDVRVDNHTDAKADVNVSAEIFQVGGDGTSVAHTKGVVTGIDANKTGGVKLVAEIKSPKLWDVDSPNLYCARVKLSRAGEIVDCYEVVFGVRTIRYTADKGFFLNGRNLLMKGMCLHDDYGPLGIEMNRSAMKYYLDRLKAMGCNAIRTAHNPPPPELLDLCDRMGFLVMDEAFNEWRIKKSVSGYHKLFDKWVEKDLRAMIRRDRNHPSIVMWSSGNEIKEQKGEPSNETSRRLTRIIHEEDPTRPVTAACNEYVESVAHKFHESVDVMGFNYKAKYYGEFHEQFPDVPIIGTETMGTFSSRGEYFFPLVYGGIRPINFQTSAYAIQCAPWGNLIDFEFKALDKNPHVAGSFFWTGVDYRGEPGPKKIFDPAALRSANFTDTKMWEQFKKDKILRLHGGFNGVLDLCGFPKDMYYLFQSYFMPDFPMAHLLPHWNWPGRKGQVTPVHLFTSGDEAELFVNGQSMGRKKKKPFQYRLQWDKVIYQPGEIRAVVYKDGKKWAEDVRVTTGEPDRISLVPHKKVIDRSGLDLSFVKVAIHDSKGRLCPRAGNMVKFSISGPGVIKCVENGDSSCFEPIIATQRSAYNGLCLVVIKAKKNKTGTITLTASADGLKSDTVTINVK